MEKKLLKQISIHTKDKTSNHFITIYQILHFDFLITNLELITNFYYFQFNNLIRITSQNNFGIIFLIRETKYTDLNDV